MRSIVFCLLLLFAIGFARADNARRLFDFSPVSADNPVVARIDGAIEIPLSELRMYRDAEKLQVVTDPASLAQKRAVLENLIDEYLLVDEACRSGVPQTAGFVRQMEATHTMILTDFMAMRAAEEKDRLPAPAAQDDFGAALAEKLFEQTSIAVSNEAYEVLKRSAKAVDEATSAANNNPWLQGGRAPMEKLREIIEGTRDGVLVRYEERSITVRQILTIYAGLPAPRPRIAVPDGLTELIKPRILPELMAIEAMKRGIAQEPAFQDRLVQNRNALLRFYMQGQIDRKTNELMKTPRVAGEMRDWFEQHQADFAVITEKETRIPEYAEARPRVEGEYSVLLRERLLGEQVQELRKGRLISVDEQVLARL